MVRIFLLLFSITLNFAKAEASPPNNFEIKFERNLDPALQKITATLKCNKDTCQWNKQKAMRKDFKKTLPRESFKSVFTMLNQLEKTLPNKKIENSKYAVTIVLNGKVKKFPVSFKKPEKYLNLLLKLETAIENIVTRGNP